MEEKLRYALSLTILHLDPSLKLVKDHQSYAQTNSWHEYRSRLAKREIKYNSTDREEKTYCFANKERIENGNWRIPWEAV